MLSIYYIVTTLENGMESKESESNTIYLLVLYTSVIERKNLRISEYSSK